MWGVFFTACLVFSFSFTSSRSDTILVAPMHLCKNILNVDDVGVHHFTGTMREGGAEEDRARGHQREGNHSHQDDHAPKHRASTATEANLHTQRLLLFHQPIAISQRLGL
jgi:hypothetical protein